MKSILPGFWTRKDGVDYEAEPSNRNRIGPVWICGRCRRGVIAHGDSLLGIQCLVCHGDIRKVKL